MIHYQIEETKINQKLYDDMCRYLLIQELCWPLKEDGVVDGILYDFNKLVQMHNEMEQFKLEKSIDILKNFNSKSQKNFNLTKGEEEANKRAHLSSSTVCTCALSQYSKFWDKHGLDKYRDDFHLDSDIPLLAYYNYIVGGLESFLIKGHEKKEYPGDERNLEAPDEFSLLNTIYFLNRIRKDLSNCLAHKKSNYSQTRLEELEAKISYSVRKGDSVVKSIILLMKEYYDSNDFRYKEHIHPFILYRFLVILKEWKDLFEGELFDNYFEKIYGKAQHEIYRQIAFHSANDLSLFDVKRLIYSLLIVTFDNRYANNLIKNFAMNLIFEKQLGTGLWPSGQVVDIDYVLEDGKIIIKKSRAIGAVPILSTVECLNDIHTHQFLSKELGRYQPKLSLTFEWLKKRLRESSNSYPEGWYPEFEGPHIPKSWVAGHSLIFIKNYCEMTANLIEKSSSEELRAAKLNNFDIPWIKLRSSYGIKSFFEKSIIDVKNGTNADYRSALIFGPPGSGKSTLGKSLAKELGWEYIEITPGLFLDMGEQNIIKKANEIFSRLIVLKKKVIFFDEVDQLVEIRESGTGSSKWIVTSLLPKFQELRKCKDIIFILAMNDITKVDPAIMRSGRVDFVLPMGLLSWHDRLKMLRDAIISSKIEHRIPLDDKFKLIQRYLKKWDDKEIEDLSPDKIDNISIQNFLINTNFMLIPDVTDVLRTLSKENWITDSMYNIFFSSESGLSASRYKNDKFEKFHKSFTDLDPQRNPRTYIKIPPQMTQEAKFPYSSSGDVNIFIYPPQKNALKRIDDRSIE